MLFYFSFTLCFMYLCLTLRFVSFSGVSLTLRIKGFVQLKEVLNGFVAVKLFLSFFFFHELLCLRFPTVLSWVRGFPPANAFNRYGWPRIWARAFHRRFSELTHYQSTAANSWVVSYPCKGIGFLPWFLA
jgi:hypothetical protein